jgi:Na+/melibiose symporter-like transporter
MDENAIDKVVTICIAAGVGAILVCSFVLPIFADMIGTLQVSTPDDPTPYAEDPDGQLDTWKTLMGVVAMIVIVAFLVAIVRSMTSKAR